jgi:hypothetical protein
VDGATFRLAKLERVVAKALSDSASQLPEGENGLHEAGGADGWLIVSKP